MKSRVCMVACGGEPHWVKVSVQSFLEQYPREKITVIDNNSCPCPETEWLQAHPGVVRVPGNPNPAKRSHGDGLDVAVRWCREHGFGIMTHIEPDCHVAGRQWRTLLEELIRQGLWVAGSHWQKYGPIHPCPGSWLVQAVRHTFALTSRLEDVRHPRYAELFDEAELRASCSNYEWEHIFRYSWDTAQKNWFSAAVLGKVGLVYPEKMSDFRHFWRGRLDTTPERIRALDPELVRYLDQDRKCVVG